MKGFTRKRNATWTAYWSVQRFDPETGETTRRQKTKGGFTRQKDAQAFLDREKVGISEGRTADPSKTPLGAFMLKEWLPGIEDTVRPLTLDRYAQCARRIARDEIGGVPLCHLKPPHISAFHTRMKAQGLSVPTRRLTHATMRRALNDAIKWEQLARNPVSAVKAPSLEGSSAKSWTNRELRTFLEHVRDDRLYALWRLGATTGMRRGELLGLAWETVDLQKGSLEVRRQVLKHPKRGTMFGPPKSKHGFRTISLDPDTVSTLRHHQEVQLVERAMAGPAYRDQDLVFCDQLGDPISPTRLTAWFIKARNAAGIKTGTLHTLRHTSVTIALTEGVPLHIVAKRMGDKPETMLAVYAHVLPHSDEMASAAVAAVLADRESGDTAVTKKAQTPVFTGDPGAGEQI